MPSIPSTPSIRASRRALLTSMPGLVLGIGLGTALSARAHDFRAGELTVDHPYALPTLPGITTGAVFFRGIRNRGKTPDRLIGASSDRAGRIEIHEVVMDGDVAKMREVDAIELPPRQTVKLRHGQRYHLMLIGLKAPLVDGQRFDLTLRFERNGEKRVTAWVQRPRDGDAEAHRHDHHDPAGAKADDAGQYDRSR